MKHPVGKFIWFSLLFAYVIVIPPSGLHAEALLMKDSSIIE